MNKKLSLMLAAFVAAGYSLTAEAGVVKVTSPVNGQAYVISNGTSLLDKLSQNTSFILQDSTTVTALAPGKSGGTDYIPSTKTGALWTVNYVDGELFTLAQVGDKSTTYLRDNSGLAMDVEAVASQFKYNSNKITLWAEGKAGNSIKLSNGKAEMDKTGSNLYFYAVTSNYLKNAENQVVTMFGEYLVVNAEGEAEFVNEEQYEALKVLAPENTTWKISDGVLESETKNSSITSKKIKFEASKGAMTVSLDGTGVALEANLDNGLFGWTDAASGKFYQIKSTTTCKEISNTGAGIFDADEDAIDVNSQIVLSASDYSTPVDLDKFTNYEVADGLNEADVFIGFINGTSAAFISKTAEENAPTTVTDPTTNADATSWTLSYDSKTDLYTIKNAEGTTFTVDGVNKFYLEGNVRGFKLYTLVGTTKHYVNYVSNAFSLTTTASSAKVFALFTGLTQYFTIGELNEGQGNNFMLDMVSSINGKELQGNVFDGRTLVAVYPNWQGGKVAGFKAYDDNSGIREYMLQDAATGEIIVVDMTETWSVGGINQHIKDGGYKFMTVTAENMAKYLEGNNKQWETLRLAYDFKIAHRPNKTDIKWIEVSYTDREAPHTTTTYYLVNYNSNTADYLTVNAKAINLVSAKFGSSLVVTGDMADTPFAWRYVNIAFDNNSGVTYKAESGKKVALDGKVLGLDSDGNPAPRETGEFLFNRPEGQWAVVLTGMRDTNNDGIVNATVDGKETAFTFINRENGETLNVSKMYKLGANKFVVEYPETYPGWGNSPFNYWKDGNSHLKRDTLIINAAPKFAYGDVAMDGYAVYTTEDLKNKLYRLALNSTVDDYYVAENHAGNHLLGLVREAANAVNWELVPMTKARELDKDGFLKTATDSVYVMNYSQSWNASKGYYNETVDTLAMVPYVLRNTANGEYLRYEGDQTQSKERMMCDPNSKNAQTKNLDEAYRFVLKQKDGDIINIIGITNPKKNHPDAAKYEYYTIDLTNKLFGATTENRGSVEVEGAYEQINSNDRFYLELVDAQQYKRMALNDTIRIYRQENNYDVMYEKGQFLNLGDIVSTTPEIAPAMVIDTAYVNRGTNNTRPQYLIVVNPRYVEPTYDQLHGDDYHLVTPDTMYGRFLVNQIDSAVWENANGKIHDNKFINDTEADETYVKLSFQWGYHTGDKLVLTDGKDGEVIETISMATPDFNKAKFAFKYTNPEAAAENPETEPFKIQTRYIDYDAAIKGASNETNEGYLKTINGVVVVTDAYDKGEEFNLRAETSDPTANETIEAASAVSVTAVDGAVVIKGAEGKNVVIATILGKVVANETVNSDNETIAVPAGIAVVSVDGESFKVVVK